MEGWSKLDLRISCCSLIVISTLYYVVCSHLCLTLSAGGLSGWKVLLNYVVETVTSWGGKREVSNVEFSFCQSTKLREPVGVSIEKWLHFMTGMLAVTSRGSWDPSYPLVQSKLFLVFKKKRNESKMKKLLCVPTIRKNSPKNPAKSNQQKSLKSSVWQLNISGFFGKLTWVTAIAVCENISVFTVQTPSKPRVWSLAVSLFLPEIWSQVSVLVFFPLSFPVTPRSELKGQPAW